MKLTEESYTSKASFLDRDEMPVYDKNSTEKYKFSGRRIERGLYRASDRRLINADVNGSYNIIRKVAPKAFEPRVVEDGKEMLTSLVVHPVRFVVTPSRNQKEKSRACGRSL